ncbi:MULTISPECIES: hypothetical protein [Rhizobium/Agrobacterium group]|uniref:Uncharacterized protein n=2 Tax=Agrobacterium TaxID=357 RepID=A0A9W5F7Q5_9HYPH|nr:MULTISPECIES: hypothetical protein [Rhizobium/Agrobacterium group]CAD7048159.1 hypothetical protein RP007_05178 [Rhizobium sp. P007]CUX02183.1 hypothetical protein AGR2A_pa40106 [Agrobacterium genomosp. 2 str. CFBP 5494]
MTSCREGASPPGTCRYGTVGGGAINVAPRSDVFTTGRVSCKYETMKPIMVIQRIVCAFAMLAVLMGPASVSTAAAAMASSGQMAGMAMDMADQSPDEEAMADMPCCPEEKKPAIPDCMKFCPLALVCSTVIVGNLSAAASLPVVLPLPMSFPRLAGAEFASALVEPPPRPPRA